MCTVINLPKCRHTEFCKSLVSASSVTGPVRLRIMVWYGNCLFDIYKRHSEKIASNTTILNTRIYNVWRLHIKKQARVLAGM